MKTIVGVFAHPDDESFGPSGTLALLAKENNVYLICVTNGDAATGIPDPKLAEARKKELENSAKVIGAKKVFFLNFGDGTLCNNNYHKVAQKIEEILDELKPEMLVTVEPRGVSGHLDHIAVSMITSFIFQKVKYVKEIWYNCMSEKMRSFIKSYFIYFPPGYSKDDIQKTVDISKVWSVKRKAIMQHKSQIKDAVGILAMGQLLPKEEYFLITKK